MICYIALAVYLVGIGLITYAFSDEGEKVLPIEAVLLIASWPVIVALAPFYFVFIFIREYWTHR